MNLHAVLGKTKGVPLFQEQAMQLAMVAAKFSDVEANQLRRAMATFRNVGTIGRFESLMVERMVARGYARICAELLRADQGLRLLRLSRKPRRELRQARLHLLLAQMPSPCDFRRALAQCPADGLLCPGADRARCARARGRGAMSLGEHVASDYQTLRLSLKAHPMTLLRRHFSNVATCGGLAAHRDGSWARVAGLVLVRQRPGKGNAIFVTLEDETGVANLVLWSRLFERFRRETMSARLMLAEGRIQKSPEGVVHLMTQRVSDRSDLLDHLWRDEVKAAPAPPDRARHPRNVRLMPKSRDFH
jgi:DNA polymerase III alpha subunit